MRTIFMIMSFYNYEGYDVVIAFAKQKPAEIFLDKLNEYHKTRPIYPLNNDIEDPENADELVYLWGKELDEWEENHPARDDTSADSFRIKSVMMEEAKP